MSTYYAFDYHPTDIRTEWFSISSSEAEIFERAFDLEPEDEIVLEYSNPTLQLLAKIGDENNNFAKLLEILNEHGPQVIKVRRS